MQAALYVIAILGCGEGDLPCEEVRRVESTYQDRGACVRAADAELARHADLAYPIVVAQCLPAGAAPVRLLPAELELPPAEAGPS